MSINSLQKQTNINIQEKANLIWEIATPVSYTHLTLPTNSLV